MSGGNAPRPVSYDVTFWKTKVIVGKRKTTYQVRWVVAGKERSENLGESGLAESFRSKLVLAAKEGIAFDIVTGLPVTMVVEEPEPEPEPEPEAPGTTWYEHACAFVDAQWPQLRPKSRRSMAEALASVTPALFATTAGMPDPGTIRKALYSWAFVSTARLERRDGHLPVEREPPEHLADAIAWLRANTVPIAGLTDAAVVRRALDLLATKIDGKPAAANTFNRKRAVIYGALGFAVEMKHFNANPLDAIKWTAPKRSHQVDPRTLVNPPQARALLAASGVKNRMYIAFFACMYYGALRPEECHSLRKADFKLPDKDTEWGEFSLSGADPELPNEWRDGGKRTAQELKHRGAGETRHSPIVPPLVAILRMHLAEFPPQPDGRIFYAPGGAPIPGHSYWRAWRAARVAVLTPAQVASPLGRRPYDLRAACVSGWLKATGDAPRVAGWAGHSVRVLLDVYAKCIDGGDAEARRRIEDDLGRHDDGPKDQGDDPGDLVDDTTD